MGKKAMSKVVKEEEGAEVKMNNAEEEVSDSVEAQEESPIDLNVHKRDVNIFVARTLKMGRQVVLEDENEEAVAVHLFQTEPAGIRIGKDMTINMGKFQSCRLDVAVTMPCYAEQVPEMYDLVDRMVEDRMMEEAKDAKRYFDGLDAKD